MSAKAKALANLYHRNRVAKDGLKKAVVDSVITAEEYKTITDEEYEGGVQ